MEKLFLAMILGHFVGDYLLQSRAMAVQKSAPGLAGLAWCGLHCVLYTAAIALFAWRAEPFFLALVFASHFPIDRWSLASKWLDLIRGRNLLAAHASTSPYRDLEVAFACLVYAVADNTMHAVLLWLIAGYLA